MFPSISYRPRDATWHKKRVNVLAGPFLGHLKLAGLKRISQEFSGIRRDSLHVLEFLKLLGKFVSCDSFRVSCTISF